MDQLLSILKQNAQITHNELDYQIYINALERVYGQTDSYFSPTFLVIELQSRQSDPQDENPQSDLQDENPWTKLDEDGNRLKLLAFSSKSEAFRYVIDAILKFLLIEFPPQEDVVISTNETMENFFNTGNFQEILTFWNENDGARNYFTGHSRSQPLYWVFGPFNQRGMP